MSDPAILSTVLDETRSGALEPVAPGVWLLPGFGNCTIVVGADGVAVIDPGLYVNGPRVVDNVRGLTDLPIRFVIYTHGHMDHAFGTPALLEDAARRGDAPPVIVGHTNVAKRFARYRKTCGHIAETFDRQFASWTPHGGDVLREARFVPPTLEFEDRIAISLGDLTLSLRHGLGETDDHTWVWIPQRRVVVGGDFIVSSIPNAGTPFRVQRYVLEWAEALEEMAGLEPAAVVSGHGGVFTTDAQEMLLTTARALRHLEDEVVRRLNDGQWYEQIVHEVTLPDELLHDAHLQPLYGCTTFAVHSILRRYTGWYDGNPTNLFPSLASEIAAEVVELAGSEAAILDRARSLAATPDVASMQRALHLTDFVLLAGGPHASEASGLKADLLEGRAKHETSFVARNILESAAVVQRR